MAPRCGSSHPKGTALLRVLCSQCKVVRELGSERRETVGPYYYTLKNKINAQLVREDWMGRYHSFEAVLSMLLGT